MVFGDEMTRLRQPPLPTSREGDNTGDGDHHTVEYALDRDSAYEREDAPATAVATMSYGTCSLAVEQKLIGGLR